MMNFCPMCGDRLNQGRPCKCSGSTSTTCYICGQPFENKTLLGMHITECYARCNKNTMPHPVDVVMEGYTMFMDKKLVGEGGLVGATAPSSQILYQPNDMCMGPGLSAVRALQFQQMCGAPYTPVPPAVVMSPQQHPNACRDGESIAMKEVKRLAQELEAIRMEKEKERADRMVHQTELHEQERKIKKLEEMLVKQAEQRPSTDPVPTSPSKQFAKFEALINDSVQCHACKKDFTRSAFGAHSKTCGAQNILEDNSLPLANGVPTNDGRVQCELCLKVFGKKSFAVHSRSCGRAQPQPAHNVVLKEEPVIDHDSEKEDDKWTQFMITYPRPILHEKPLSKDERTKEAKNRPPPTGVECSICRASVPLADLDRHEATCTGHSSRPKSRY